MAVAVASKRNVEYACRSSARLGRLDAGTCAPFDVGRVHLPGSVGRFSAGHEHIRPDLGSACSPAEPIGFQAGSGIILFPGHLSLLDNSNNILILQHMRQAHSLRLMLDTPSIHNGNPELLDNSLMDGVTEVFD